MSEPETNIPAVERQLIDVLIAIAETERELSTLKHQRDELLRSLVDGGDCWAIQESSR